MHSTVWSHTTHGTRSYVISRTGQWRPELGLLLPIGHIVILHIRSLSLSACVVWAHISTIPWPLSHINTAVELWGKFQWNACYQMTSLAFRFYKIQFWPRSAQLGELMTLAETPSHTRHLGVEAHWTRQYFWVSYFEIQLLTTLLHGAVETYTAQNCCNQINKRTARVRVTNISHINQTPKQSYRPCRQCSR